MPLTIAVAKPAEATAIAALVGELLSEIMRTISSPAFSFNHSETEERVRHWLKEGRYRVFVARLTGEGEPIGFLALYESYALYAAGAFGTIPELYVRPAFRSQGVGRALLAEAVSYGKARGWKRLEVTTPPLPEFQRTASFYEREGFHRSGGIKMKADVP